MKKEVLILKSILIVLISILIESCSNKKEEKIYEDGMLHFRVEVKNEMWHGNAYEYYKTGELRAHGHYKEGKLHGKQIIYFKNGGVNQIQYFENGIPSGRWDFFYPDGGILEYQYFDIKGNKYNYIKFNEAGKQEKSPFSKKAIILNSTDTLSLGDEFKAEIRLGNRNYNNFEVFIGDPDNDSTIYGQPFNKKPTDFYSVIVNLNTDTFDLGKNIIEGVIVEFDTLKRDTLNIIPFEKEVFVLEK